jgi:hypothetical protein
MRCGLRETWGCWRHGVARRERRFGPWWARRIDDVLDDLGRPRVVAVDGRSAQRPWERAHVIVDGAPELPHGPLTELVVADDGAGSPFP